MACSQDDVITWESRMRVVCTHSLVSVVLENVADLELLEGKEEALALSTCSSHTG
jgi:hypothetical protein